MTRQQEIIEEVKRLMDELASLGQTPKGYELDHPFERSGICLNCNRLLPYGTYGMRQWCMEYKKDVL